MPNAQEVLDWMAWDKERKANMTNEEWLRQKSVEELAVFLAMVQLDEYEKPIDSAYVNTWVLWLKEKHYG